MIDRRTTTGKALVAGSSELLADLAGIEAVSTPELALVEEAVKTKLILDSVDAWPLSQKTLINTRTHWISRTYGTIVDNVRGGHSRSC